jgi:hypothetical protein
MGSGKTSVQSDRLEAVEAAHCILVEAVEDIHGM